MMFERVNDIHEDIRMLIKKVEIQNGRVKSCELSLKDKVDVDRYEIDQRDHNKRMTKLIIVVVSLASGAGIGVTQLLKLFTG